jgi:Flp pilus assembly protein TadG
LKPHTHLRSQRRGKSGQALILLLICLFVVLGFAGLAADAGHIYLVKRSAQNAADAAALAAGKQLIGAVQTSPPQHSSDAAPKEANAFASNNGFNTSFNNGCDSASSTSFTTTWVDTGSCSNNSGANTVITIHDPPVVAPDGTPVPSACLGKYNCFQVVIQTKVRNYIMGVFGFGTTTVTASAVVNATPKGTGYALPPAIALYLYEPAGAFDVSLAPSRTLLSCAAGGVAGTVKCPTFWAKQGGTLMISGVDGKNLTPATDTVAIESAGHMLIQGQTTICDPYNGYVCKSNAVGAGTDTLGFATGPAANIYCAKLNNSAAGCTTGAQSNLNNLWGNSTAYNTTTFAPAVDTSGLNDCSSLDLILNGDSVASKTSGLPCAPPASDPYVVQPGKYHSIVINHGTYEFASGLFDITGTAPVMSYACNASNYWADGIDHCNETNSDQDLCNNTSTTPACPSLTAGVWIGHGKGNKGAYVAPSSGTCSGGSAGTGGGGGDQTVISGAGVAFRLESTSGGFVSTNETQVIGLSAPGVGAMDAVGDIPLLIDEENNAYIHLDAGSSPPSGTFSQFSGIVYQKTTATAGGVEMAADLSHNNGGALLGQVLAYSFTSWGTGTAVDFSQGFGSTAPKITTSGNAENSVITTPAPSVTAAVDHSGNPLAGYETFTVNYTDEWALDGYDTYIRVNGASPVFFSQNEWGPQPATGAALPPQGPSANLNPNDYAGPPTMAAWPVYPSGSGSTVTYGNGASSVGYTAYSDSKTGKNDDWVETIGSGATPSYFETSGSWTWGHQHDISGAQSGTYNATIKYTFPTPTGTSVALTVFLTDGDHCGDYATASYTFANIGQPNGGSQTGGSVELLE